jgi:hypothetical protein
MPHENRQRPHSHTRAMDSFFFKGVSGPMSPARETAQACQPVLRFRNGDAVQYGRCEPIPLTLPLKGRERAKD